MGQQQIIVDSIVRHDTNTMHQQEHVQNVVTVPIHQIIIQRQVVQIVQQ